MPITNYTELQSAIQRWLDNNNPNLVAEIPTFIELAEARFRNNLRVREMECYTSTPYVPAGVTEETRGVYDLPPDWGGHISVELRDDLIWMLYMRKIESLASAAAGTNWLLKSHPDLYLFSSLVSAESWLKNDPRIALWDKAASAIYESIAAADEADKYSGGPLKIRSDTNLKWRQSTPGNGRYEYLPPHQFAEVLIGDPGCGAPAYFTVTESFLRVYPRPALP